MVARGGRAARVFRRDTIISSAAQLFRRKGFVNVSMREIGDAAGITASAIYRHFPTKLALLDEAIERGLQDVEAELLAPDPELLRALAESGARHDELWVLMRREVRHLDATARRRHRARFEAIVVQVAARCGGPSQSPAVRQTLARAVLAVNGAPSQYRQRGSLTHTASLIAAITHHLVEAGPAALRAPMRRVPTFGESFRPDSRREQIVDAATRLFALRGYPDVSLDDIGVVVGIAGPSVYHHFESKADVLAAVMRRAVDLQAIELIQARRAGPDPDAVLARALEGYAAMAVYHADLFRIVINETVHLAPGDRTPIVRAQRDAVENWTRLVIECRPELDTVSSRVLATATLALVNDLSALPGFAGGRDGVESLLRLATTVATTRIPTHS